MNYSKIIENIFDNSLVHFSFIIRDTTYLCQSFCITLSMKIIHKLVCLIFMIVSLLMNLFDTIQYKDFEKSQSLTKISNLFGLFSSPSLIHFVTIQLFEPLFLYLLIIRIL